MSDTDASRYSVYAVSGSVSSRVMALLLAPSHTRQGPKWPADAFSGPPLSSWHLYA